MDEVKKSVIILFGGILSEHTALNVAATGRVYDLANIMRAAGYKPIIIGFSNNRSAINDEKNYAIYIVKKEYVPGLKKAANFFEVNKNLKSTLSTIFKRERVVGLLYQSAFARLIFPTLFAALKSKIPLGVIANDWYEYSGDNLSYFETELTWRSIYPHFHNFIVTSTFFQQYFMSARKSNVLYIPAIFNISSMPAINDKEPYDSKRTRIAYAGNMKNKKEQIDLVIRAIADLKNTCPENHIELHLYGNEEIEIRTSLGEDQRLLDDIKEHLFFHGFVERTRLQQELQKMDFTILVRPHKRYAEAGFATKFAESLCLGVPVIANLTGDIGNYLQDGKNGLVIEHNTIAAIKSALIRADYLTYQEKCSMRKSALEMGRRNFNLYGYVEAMKEFLSNMEK